MPRSAFLLVLAACGGGQQSTPEQKAPSDGVPLSHHVSRDCRHAATGLSGATRGVRDPETDVVDGLIDRCQRDGWPSDAVDCFAQMAEGELGRCAKLLEERAREGMFAVLAGNEPSAAGLYVAKARLQQVQVGIESCDRFVAAVTTILACDGLSIEMRLQLGNETAQFWSLPTDRLAADDRQRMSQVCVTSLETLAKETAPVGCTL
jgi:hypothetical protein